mgnify:CR=1 FL=1
MYQDLIDKKKKIAVIGLGYVGLPIALEFAKYFSVIGFDINQERIELLNKKIDPSHELTQRYCVGRISILWLSPRQLIPIRCLI